MHKFFIILVAVLAGLSCSKNEPGVPDHGLTETFEQGKGIVEFTGYQPLSSRPIYIHYYIPPANDRHTMPILLVFPGTNRNADEYLNAWVAKAASKGVMVFSLEFPLKDYPNSSDYIEGWMFSGSTPRDRSLWSFSAIAPIFDFIRDEIQSTRTTYDIWGHSAGAQFVQRFMLFCPDSRVGRAVAANPGWYTMPDTDVAYPYGLKNSGQATVAVQQAYFACPLTVQLGTSDVNVDSNLRVTAQANAQGANRLERGRYFYSRSHQITAARGWAAPVWQKVETPGVAHEYQKMAAAAAEFLY